MTRNHVSKEVAKALRDVNNAILSGATVEQAIALKGCGMSLETYRQLLESYVKETEHRTYKQIVTILGWDDISSMF